MLFHEHTHNVFYSSTILMSSDLKIQIYCLVFSSYPIFSCCLFKSSILHKSHQRFS